MRTTPVTPRTAATTINAMVTAIRESAGEPEVPFGAPVRNQGAATAIEPHHTAAATVMTTMAMLAALAMAASNASSWRPSGNRRPTATATTVHSARLATTSAAQVPNTTP